MLLTQRLAFKLLAPTVLVSLILLGACLSGTLYINHIHVKNSDVLSENVKSTLAAAQLETWAKETVRQLRSDHTDAPDFADKMREQNQAARPLLDDAENLANLPQESVLVSRVETGLKDYLARWDRRRQEPAAQHPGFDRALADLLEKEVLAPCVELRKYNTGQIEQSDAENQTIITTFKWGMVAVGLGGPLSGLLVGYALTRHLHRSIYQLSVRIRDAAGRLSRELGSVTLEEEGDLPNLHEQMRGVIEEIGRVVDQLEQREREVLRAEQLAAVGQVAAGVAHELRNPLTSIKMLVQTSLQDAQAGGLPAEDLTVIDDEIRRIEHCLQTFLDFARPPRCERRRADLIAVAQRAVTLVEGRARHQKVTLATHFPSAPVCLDIDPEQVRQVLVNLLLNALDALPRGGAVRIEIAQQPALDKVEVRVRDTGPGILPHIRPRLFDPFISSKETGLGLGLSICKRLIEAHGGTIQGTSASDGGAEFVFNLPLGEASAPASHGIAVQGIGS